MASIRDTLLGFALRSCGCRVSGLLFPEEREGFCPSSSAKQIVQERPTSLAPLGSSSEELAKEESTYDSEAKQDFILVDWYSNTDEANPRSWSPSRKAWVAFIICYFTFVAYIASAIFVPSMEWIMLRFGVSQELASLGLSMYVAGYGLGPMLFSPLSEIAYIGRNPPYLASLVLFLAVSLTTALVADKSFTALMVLRFLQGFCGSPILASGGASMADIYDLMSVPYAFIFWVGSMYCGPALGPIMAAYAVPVDWRWPLWEIVLMIVPLLVLLPLLPETSHAKILQQRAARIRKATGGDARYKSAEEMVKLDTAAIFMDAMIKPVEIAIKDPAVGFVCIYGSLVYATYYSFFEAFPLVYSGIYGMTLGTIGQVFLFVVVGCVLFASAYAAYLYYIFIPRARKQEMVQETWLRPALPAVFLLPAGLFLFAWTARADVHWIVPTIGIAIYAGSSFVVFQSVICYVPLTYPAYVASLFAANDFCRSSLAAGFVMFSRDMYIKLGIAKGVSLLGGLSVMGVLGIWFLYFYGANMRARSRFAVG